MSMLTLSMEQRLSEVEFEVAAMRHSISTLETDLDKLPWWEEISGSFANNEAYDGAMRLGREYRESSRPAAV